MPFGNPFKFIVRIKNSKYNGQQTNELLASEDSYLNSGGLGQNSGIKNSQNLLINRLPKLRKLKNAEGPDLRKKVKYDGLLIEDNDTVTPTEEEVAPMLYDEYSASLPSYDDGNSEMTKKPWRDDEDMLDEEEEITTNSNISIREFKSKNEQNGKVNINGNNATRGEEENNNLDLNRNRSKDKDINCGVEQEELDDEEDQEYKSAEDENSKIRKSKSSDQGYNPE